MMGLDKKTVYISGLVMKYKTVVEEDTNLDLLGPALYAAIGARLMGCHPELVSCVSVEDLSRFRKFVSLFNIGSSYLSTINRQTLVWAANATLSRKGYGRLSDDPSLWSNYSTNLKSQSQVLFISNSDPTYINEFVEFNNPIFSTLDLYSQWISSRRNEVEKLIDKVNVIMGTVSEFDMLCKMNFSDYLKKKKTIILKMDSAGFTVIHEQKSILVSAPKIGEINCDIGAGDLLFGAISIACYQNYLEKSDDYFKNVLRAYEILKPALTLLLKCDSPMSFVKALTGEYAFS